MEETLQINGLKPIIAPEGISFWPPAPVWYVVAGVLLLLFVYVIFLNIRSRKKHHYRSLSLKMLQEIREAERIKIGPKEIHELNRLLKITALAVFPREMVASLSGDEWLAFLEFTCPGTIFKSAPANLIAQVGLKKAGSIKISENDWMELLNLCETWIKHHKATKRFSEGNLHRTTNHHTTTMYE